MLFERICDLGTTYNLTWLPTPGTAPPDETHGNYTDKECVAGRLLEKALKTILSKMKESDDDETNDGIAAQEARGQGADHTSIERLLRMLLDVDEDNDEETSTRFKK